MDSFNHNERGQRDAVDSMDVASSPSPSAAAGVGLADEAKASLGGGWGGGGRRGGQRADDYDGRARGDAVGETQDVVMGEVDKAEKFQSGGEKSLRIFLHSPSPAEPSRPLPSYPPAFSAAPAAGPSHALTQPTPPVVPPYTLFQPPPTGRLTPRSAARRPPPLTRYADPRKTPPPPSHTLYSYLLPIINHNVGLIMVGIGGATQRRIKAESGLAELTVRFYENEPQTAEAILLGTVGAITRALDVMQTLIGENWRMLNYWERDVLKNRTWLLFDSSRAMEQQGVWARECFSDTPLMGGSDARWTENPYWRETRYSGERWETAREESRRWRRGDERWDGERSRRREDEDDEAVEERRHGSRRRRSVTPLDEVEEADQVASLSGDFLRLEIPLISTLSFLPTSLARRFIEEMHNCTLTLIDLDSLPVLEVQLINGGDASLEDLCKAHAFLCNRP